VDKPLKAAYFITHNVAFRAQPVESISKVYLCALRTEIGGFAVFEILQVIRLRKDLPGAVPPLFLIS
jgi:hypothetical protein